MSVLASRQAQSDEALVLAQSMRLTRVALKRQVHSRGRLGANVLAAAVLECPPILARAYVWRVVLWVPKIGPDSKAPAMLRAAGIDPWERLGALSQVQREALAEQLHRHARGLLPLAARKPRKPAAVPVSVPPVVSPPPAAVTVVRVAGPRKHREPTCKQCGEHLVKRSPSGLCGFCEEEAAA